MSRHPTPKPPDDTPGGTALVRTSVGFRRDQLAALKAEAARRQAERIRRGDPTGKVDASEIIRELVDAWMKRGE